MTRLPAFLIGLIALMFGAPAHAAEPLKPAQTRSVILAGGCFWCVESDFDKLDGIVSTTSGYAGGSIENPTYENYHDTGEGIVPHIEVVEIVYDTAKLSYPDVLDYYFRHIDPTDGGGQFCDRGPAYRPAIFAGNEDEKAEAEAAKSKVAGLLGKDIAVDILPKAKFWPAEDYHQDYHNKNEAKYSFYRWKCGRDQKVKDVWCGVK